MTRTGEAAGTVEDFATLAEPFRSELLAHCYRMLGSVDEAEDLVQETFLRAWRAYDRFEGRSSLRTWLYQIATNVCLTALRRAGRRVLPSGLGAPGEDPFAPPETADPHGPWLQPLPDALVTAAAQDPAAVVVSRESLRLALIACLQYLPPRQRAVLILRDVLAFPAPEVARMLGTTTAAVKSSLQRARARLEEVGPAADLAAEPSGRRQRELLEGYVAAFENSDAAAFERLLRQDAALEMPPTPTWFSGRATCVPFLASAAGSPGDWLMVPTTANGQPAAAAYRRGPDGVHRAFGLAVLTVTEAGISRIVAFGFPGILTRLGLPETRTPPR
ncbi:sigma-70 family RNA polymerase sigma factor [Actinomadura kijaniata]|uniref:sigma-70 family RNA polymerase sigma factor n=1 Tax=Actinomadura kijaniata TaxID=46161 RepID=UPI00082D91BF|nr:sigma-70 family RNA polymerase sigma factor [Actinomadura kijaniata]